MSPRHCLKTLTSPRRRRRLSAMAAVNLLKLKPRRRLPFRLLSTSSSPPRHPPDASSPSADADSAHSSPPPPPTKPPSFSHYFSDIKDRLKVPSPPSRRIPSDSAPPAFPSSAPASLEEVRRKLREFQRNAPPPDRSSMPFSFQEILKNRPSNPAPPPPATPPGTGRISFDSIRESLRNIPSPPGAPGRPTPGSPLDSFREATRPGGPADPASPFPSIRPGLDFRRRAPADRAGRLSPMFNVYSDEDLGEKLRQLRPPAPAGATDWFSVRELRERLDRMQKLEDQKQAAGFLYPELRESLRSISTAGNAKQQVSATGQRLSALLNLSGKMKPEFMLKEPQSELLDRYLHPDHLSAAEKMKLELQRVRDEFKMSESDCGSTRVQIAQLTTKINYLQKALHKKDKHSTKGLRDMVQRRKKLLKYLRRTDWDSYCFVLSKLGLRDVPEYKEPSYKIKA